MTESNTLTVSPVNPVSVEAEPTVAPPVRVKGKRGGRSTGRGPALSPRGVRSLLERYASEDEPSIADLCGEFTTQINGEARPLSVPTVRKYLLAAGVQFTRGRPKAGTVRNVGSVQNLMNKVPTSLLLGRGRSELLGRRLQAGEGSVSSLASEFEISRKRVKAFQADVSRPVFTCAEAPEPTTA